MAARGHVCAATSADPGGERAPSGRAPASGGAGEAAAGGGAHDACAGRASGLPGPAAARGPGRAGSRQGPVRRRRPGGHPEGEREIFTLQEQLLSSEATVRSLQAAVEQRDQMIQELQPRADLLQDITRQRPPLAALLATLEEAEELGPLPSSHSHGAQLLPDGPGPPLGNSMREEEGQDDQQPAVFGTTV
ncbi:vimentin-type intermediate filament-associated coiled-coil protein isoform X2 [Rattus norvegicus]|uniref:vimentin-type intermediate filament-associated coiled-coil protein isoform X2 n=1 Tax=Rattus norvegicus TaxID=10116 RepID=UPI0004E4799B|nr:vimentin-type intermediate filament-associated coiled-coil protein isoform X2 [Rattus norvegicus]|eukprot:XP_008764988.1 PREDICTED: vimentin-type intermediate filament-associated coiled-coil protein isoform X2 [Rattus norvegicus]